MSRAVVLIGLMGMTVALPQAGQLYRWVDSNGVVQYSDQPPPVSAKKVQTLSSYGRSDSTTQQFSAASLAAKEKNPVTYYANACGPVCDKAEAYLKQRGIPYILKDPAKESEAAKELRSLIGTLEVPVILVGKTHQKGFDASSWGSLLDAAGYPQAPAASDKPQN